MERRLVKTADKAKFVIIGFMQGWKCKECSFFKRDNNYSKNYNRCTKYYNRNNNHPHWLANLEACSFFELKLNNFA